LDGGLHFLTCLTDSNWPPPTADPLRVVRTAPPPAPKVTIPPFGFVCKNLTRDVQVTVFGVIPANNPVVFKFSKTSGTQGEAKFLVGGQERDDLPLVNPDGGTTGYTFTIKGKETSSTLNNMKLQAVYNNTTILGNEDFTVLEFTLEKEGQTVIEPANNYSENTTLKVTVQPSNITGFKAKFMELQTEIYNGQNGATDLTMPPTVQIVNGVARLTVKSVSNSNMFSGPSPAFIFVDLLDSNNETGCRSDSIGVKQWVDEDGDMRIDWLMKRANDLLSCFKTKSGEVGQSANTVTGIRQMQEGDRGPFGTACGAIQVKDVTVGTDENVIAVIPVCVVNNVNVFRLNINLALSDTVIHEARHAWQNTLTLRTDLGAIDDINKPGTPPNDDDRDFIPEKVPAGSEAEPVLPDRAPTTAGDAIQDPRQLMLDLRETEARLFASKHKQKCP
jgi:hypothetical protein